MHLYERESSDQDVSVIIADFISGERMPKGPAYWVIGKQLVRSSTSVGANYRAVSRAKSKPDFIHKLTIVEEEADKSLYWLELLAVLDLPEETLAEINLLKTEMNEILSMVVASIKTMKRK